MTKLTRTFFDIFLLRQSPSQLPYSKFLLGFLIVLDILVNVAAAQILILVAKQATTDPSAIANITIGVIFNVVVISIGLLLGFVYFALALYQKSDRFVQMITALIGLDILLSILSFGILFLMFIPILALIYYIILLYWEFMIYAHVFSKGFDIDMLKSCFVSLIFLILKHNVAEWVFKSISAVS